MQRQDDYQLTRDAMLRFIAQLSGLADIAIQLVAAGRVDHRLLGTIKQAEHIMLVLFAGILTNVDTSGQALDAEPCLLPLSNTDSDAEMLRLEASLQQIAVMLALVLALYPRAFRDRSRIDAFPHAADAACLAGIFRSAQTKIPALRPEARAPPWPKITCPQAHPHNDL